MQVTVGMNTDGNVSSETLYSLARMWNAHPEFESRLIKVDGGCADFAGSRNRLVRAFLSTGIDWLLIVDADMKWEPEDWARLRDSAGDENLFVTGTYFVDNEPIRPCCIIVGPDEKVYSPQLTEDSPELLRVSASCVGFGLIHRDVFLKSGDMTSDHEWFEHGWKGPGGSTLPEDWAFCYRVNEAGIPIHLNTKVRPGHLKQRVLGWEEYQSQQAPISAVE